MESSRARLVAITLIALGTAAEAAMAGERTGLASWYGAWHHGRTTASGERFDMRALTAAHRTLPLGTWIRVTNLENDRSVAVRVNDRGPFIANRILDLSRAAAERLGAVAAGVVRVRVEILDVPVAPALASSGRAGVRVARGAPRHRAAADGIHVRRAAGRHDHRAAGLRAPAGEHRGSSHASTPGVSGPRPVPRAADAGGTSTTVRRPAGRLDRGGQ